MSELDLLAGMKSSAEYVYIYIYIHTVCYRSKVWDRKTKKTYKKKEINTGVQQGQLLKK